MACPPDCQYLGVRRRIGCGDDFILTRGYNLGTTHDERSKWMISPKNARTG